MTKSILVEAPTATGPFNLTDELRIRRAPNSGYVLEAHNGNACYAPTLIGAYSNKADLLAALAEALQ